MALKQICYKVLVPGEEPYSAGGFAFDTNLLAGGQKATKVSIEAPPGTIVQINTKDIMIGQSGLWDFNNEDIVITSIIFPTPKVYSRGAVDTAKRNALRQILEDQIQPQIQNLGDMELAPAGSTSVYYKEFCQTGQNIFLGGDGTHDYQYDGKVLHGFQDVIFEYLSVIQGDLQETNGDLENVIINYTYSIN